MADDAAFDQDLAALIAKAKGDNVPANYLDRIVANFYRRHGRMPPPPPPIAPPAPPSPAPSRQEMWHQARLDAIARRREIIKYKRRTGMG